MTIQLKYYAVAAAFSCFAMVSTTATAGGDPDEFPAAGELTDSEGNVIEGVQIAAEEPATAAATPNDQTAFFQSIGSAIKPASSVPALLNDRVTSYLSDEVFFLQFERNAARYDLEQARIGLGFLVSEERDTLFQLGVALDAPSDLVNNIRLSVGTRAYVALIGEENNDAFAAGLGFEAAYQLPSEKLPLELSTAFYYAPDVFTFGQGDRIIDWTIDVTLPFRPRLSVFTGVRYLQIDTRPDDLEVDNRWHVGLRWDLD